MSRNRDRRRARAILAGMLHRNRTVAVALCGLIAGGLGSFALAQPLSEQQIRCMQLEQELAVARGGGGQEDLGGIEEQIRQNDRVYQGTRAAMEDAGCFESFFIFGRGLVRSPKCLKMNQRLDDARRQLTQLQQQRDAVRGGGGNRRRQAELRDALARNGCVQGQTRQAARRGGGLFDWFGGRDEPEMEEYETPISRSINPGARYRSICVRLCDGFFYPVSYSTYGSRLAQDAEQCQNNCAAPAELYVYRNPGQGPEQAISLTGSAYIDLPVAFKYRKEYVKGCSCKQVEYNPTEIEAANKQAEAAPEQPSKAKPGAKNADAAAAAAPEDAAGESPPPQLDLDLTGTTAAADDAEPAPPEAAPTPAPAAEAPAAAEAVPQQQPAQPPPEQTASETETQGQSTVVKRRATPVVPQ